MTTEASEKRREVKDALGIAVAAVLGTGFFFFIIGVFGLSAAILALLLYIGVALLVFRRQQGERSIP